MHFLFLAAQFEFMTWFPTMILYFKMCTGFTAGPNIIWDVNCTLEAPSSARHDRASADAGQRRRMKGRQTLALLLLCAALAAGGRPFKGRTVHWGQNGFHDGTDTNVDGTPLSKKEAGVEAPSTEKKEAMPLLGPAVSGSGGASALMGLLGILGAGKKGTTAHDPLFLLHSVPFPPLLTTHSRSRVFSGKDGEAMDFKKIGEAEPACEAGGDQSHSTLPRSRAHGRTHAQHSTTINTAHVPQQFHTHTHAHGHTHTTHARIDRHTHTGMRKRAQHSTAMVASCSEFV